MIAIIDYHMGNLASVRNAIERLGGRCAIVSDPDMLGRYDRALLPGVGAFGDAMMHLKAEGMDAAVVDFAKSGKPMLGICLGMQLLFSKSLEFGEHAGLGLIEGEVIPFCPERFRSPHKIPHMGWNVMHVEKATPLFKGMAPTFYLYFVHSYHANGAEASVIGTTAYGYRFVSAVAKENIFGIQPHPEKSHDNGLHILKNFMEL